MADAFKKNEAFIHNIYAKGPFQGHAFTVIPAAKPSWELEYGDFTISDKPVENWVPWIVERYQRYLKLHETIGDDSVPVAKLSTGTHIYAAAFGCKVHTFTDNNPCALPFIHTCEDADKLEEPDIWKSPALYRIFELGRLVQKELGEDVYLGPPDMQSGFDTACLVWNKEDLFCSMILDDEREAVKRMVSKCANLFKKFLIEFRKEFSNCSPCHCPETWTPPEMGPWLSNDECGAFSTEMFEEFCLPELVDLAETFGGLGMHCCADADHQLESFKKIPGFYGFNRVADRDGLCKMLEPLGGPDAPVHVLAWIEDDVAERLIRNAPEGTRFIFNMVGAEDADEAKAWYEKMRKLSPRCD